MKARYKPGDRVRVRVEYPAGHFRTPGYIQGKTGWIETVHGAFGNPELLAYGGDGRPEQFLYLVRFEHGDLWAQARSAAHDKLLIDLYEHWLEPA